MEKKLAEKLDKCLEMVYRGEPVEGYLDADDTDNRQIEELLDIASSLAFMPRGEPSRQFREAAQGRLMARLGLESSRVKVAELKQQVTIIDNISSFTDRLRAFFTGPTRLVIPISLVLIVAIIMAMTSSNLRYVPATLASECTLSILGGNVEVSGQDGADGMTLTVGTRIKTSEDSRALLTFFDGSTVTLEPGTEIEIRQVDSQQDHGMNIVLKQWAGRTWSRVVKMADAGWHYEIETPTATAIVRGTLFSTTVDEQGDTIVATTEGLVSVAADGEEVFLPPQQTTSVKAGEKPTPPTASPEPVSLMTFRFDSGAFCSVIDPSGASTGQLPDGIIFNQIAGSQYLSPTEGSGEIIIPEPIGGEYTFILRFVNNEAVHFDITGTSGGQAVFGYADSCGGNGENGYIVKFKLQVENGNITGGQVESTKPLHGETPERIVMPATTTQTVATAAVTYEEGRSLMVYSGGTAPSDEGNLPEEDGATNKDDLTDAGNTVAPQTNVSEDSRENTSGTADGKNPTPVTDSDPSGGTKPTVPNAGTASPTNQTTTTTPPTPASDPTTPALNTTTTPAPDPTTPTPDPTTTLASDPTTPTPDPTTTTTNSNPQPDHGEDDHHGHSQDDDDDDSDSLLDDLTDLLGGLFD